MNKEDTRVKTYEELNKAIVEILTAKDEEVTVEKEPILSKHKKSKKK